MIQFKRGSKKNWLELTKPLADGQPGYDKSRNKIKIGDGTKLWSELSYASGLTEEEILSSEIKAKARALLDPDDRTIITYGTARPDENTIGQLYLQHYETEPEVDYVVDYGLNNGWFYRKWHSGRAECWGCFEVETDVRTPHENKIVYYSKPTDKNNYPLSFIEVPYETATLQSPNTMTWLASINSNTKTSSGKYYIMSFDKLSNGTYTVILQVTGYWRD